MAGWTEQDLTRSWRALARESGSAEWRFIPLANFGPLRMEVGCRFPGALEALVMHHPADWAPKPSALPVGRGFDAILLSIDGANTSASLALVRRPEGAQEIFAIMSADLLRLLDANWGLGGQLQMEAFIDRVEEWQDFMSRRRRPMSSEQQLGLYGELHMLELLGQTQLGDEGAFASWQGPLKAAQDFHVGQAAIEVKSTVMSDQFPAKISSITQLDCDRAPLYLCAFRYAADDNGRSLPDLVESVRQRYGAVGLERSFNALLLVVGYQDDHAEQYGRRLLLTSSRVFLVESDFPRLVRSILSPAILAAKYVIDLDVIAADGVPEPIPVEECFKALGLVRYDA